MHIAVLLPCFNEATTIAKVVQDFKHYLPHANIYVYDNNSTDNTGRIAQNAGAIVRPVYAQGKGNVIRAMFRDIDADVYLMADGDDTYPAKHALEMIQPILDGKADMVIGDRLSSTYFQENKRPLHNTGNKTVRWLINTLWSANIVDIMTGYRAFNQSFVKNFPVMSSGFEIETEMSIHALDKRFSLIEVPIDYKDRPEGSVSKLNTFSDGIKVLKTIFTLFKEYKPLLFFSILSIVSSIVFAAMFIPVFIEYLETGLVLRFPTLIVSSIFALIAVFSFFTGLILDTIITKDRKNYELRLIRFNSKQKDTLA